MNTEINLHTECTSTVAVVNCCSPGTILYITIIIATVH